MKVKYVGPNAPVVLEVDKSVVEVEFGEEFDIPDDEGERLLEQPDNWEQVAAGRPSKKASAKADPTKED